MTFLSILAVLLAVAGGIVVLVAGTILLLKAGVTVLEAVGAVFGRIFEFVGGVFSDATRLVGATVAAVIFIPLALFNVVIGRWSAANHFADAFQRELRIVACRAVSILARRPMRLLFLDGMLEGVEQRAVEAVRHAPGPDKPRRGNEFPGFEITGSLPSGGSGAKLYIARPDETTRRRLDGAPDEVVIKSFALAEGSSLPQIVRESRSLDAARRLGLVLAHELDDSRFWYAMPYHPGDNLSVVVRHAHAFSGESGVEQDDLGRLLGYAVDLVGTLDRYHLGGMWHKDVKPDNIIVHDGAAHLVDFGLVSSLKSAMTLTTHGTEYFRDPEMVRMAMKGVKVHEVNGAKFDVYGAGAVLYFMLENTFPGHGGLSRFERRSPEALRMIVRRAMADYAHRYDSAAEMLADLQTVAAASDPWSVKPAMLPSLGGRELASESGSESGAAGPASPPPVAAVSVARRTPPPPPPVAAPSRRPDIRVTGWWSGGYDADGSGRRRAVEQVSAARRRAATRRQAVAPGSSGRISAVLSVLVLGVISALIGLALTLEGVSGPVVDGPMARRGRVTEDGTSVTSLSSGLEFFGDHRLPGESGTARTIVIDDQRPTEGGATSVAERLTEVLKARGWVVLDAADDEARARIEWDSVGGGDDRPLAKLGVDAIHLVRSFDQGDGHRVRIERRDPVGSAAIVVDLAADESRPGAVPGAETPEGTVIEGASSRVVEIRLDDRMSRIGDRLGRLGERLGDRFGRVGSRFVEIDWTSDTAATIVSPNGVIIHDN